LPFGITTERPIDVIVVAFVPYPTRPDPVTVARIDSVALPPAAFLGVTTITAAASVDAAFGAYTDASVVAVVTSPEFRIEVVVAAEGTKSGALTVTVHATEGPVAGRVVRIRASYVPATDGATNETVNFAVTYPGVPTVELTSAERFVLAIATVAVVVSSNVSVADLLAVAGCENIAESTVAVSAAVSEIKDNVTTAVAVSPALIASVAESIVSVGAITAALVGSADITPKVIAAATPRAIFLNEFIFLLVSFYNKLRLSR
jgi:hypothetical protein